MAGNEMNISSGGTLQALIKDLKKMKEPPDYKVIGALESALAAAFAETQAATHVITASLKMSGKTSSDFDGKEWTGEITYGGASAGANNPVRYAIYEMARGGEHDFFSGLPGTFSKFEDGVRKHFE